jgi:hypothetical protein
MPLLQQRPSNKVASKPSVFAGWMRERPAKKAEIKSNREKIEGRGRTKWGTEIEIFKVHSELSFIDNMKCGSGCEGLWKWGQPPAASPLSCPLEGVPKRAAAARRRAAPARCSSLPGGAAAAAPLCHRFLGLQQAPPAWRQQTLCRIQHQLSAGGEVIACTTRGGRTADQSGTQARQTRHQKLS